MDTPCCLQTRVAAPRSYSVVCDSVVKSDEKGERRSGTD